MFFGGSLEGSEDLAVIKNSIGEGHFVNQRGMESISMIFKAELSVMGLVQTMLI